MTQRQIKLVENYIRLKVKSVLKEIQISKTKKNRLGESASKWSLVSDGRAEFRDPKGQGYYVCKADEYKVFTYSISLHKKDNSIQYLKKNIDGEKRLNQELLKLNLPKIDERAYHGTVSDWYDSLDEMEPNEEPYGDDEF